MTFLLIFTAIMIAATMCADVEEMRRVRDCSSVVEIRVRRRRTKKPQTSIESS